MFYRLQDIPARLQAEHMAREGKALQVLGGFAVAALVLSVAALCSVVYVAIGGY